MATTILLEQPTEAPPEVLALARGVIGVCRFRYASSVPDSPHEYCRRDWLPADRLADFDRLLALIREHGFRGKFMSTVYRYVTVDDFRYWQSPSFFPPATVILNRANNSRAPMVGPVRAPRARLSS